MLHQETWLFKPSSGAEEPSGDVAGCLINAGGAEGAVVSCSQQLRSGSHLLDNPSLLPRRTRALAYTYLAGLHHGEGVGQALAVVTHELDNGLSEALASIAGESNEDDARGLSVGGERQPAEVLVFGEKDAMLPGGEVDEVAVGGAGHRLTHGKHFIPRGSQHTHDGEVKALVGEESERPVFHEPVRRSMVS